MLEYIPNWHPLFVHFTMALLSLSVLFFILQLPLAATEIGDNFLVFARYSLTLGVAFTVLTVIAGINAYNSVGHDTHSLLALNNHRFWAIVSATIFLSSWLWSLVNVKGKDKAGPILILMLIAGAGCLFVTGYKGSLLVFDYGLGVKSVSQVVTPPLGHDQVKGHHANNQNHETETVQEQNGITEPSHKQDGKQGSDGVGKQSGVSHQPGAVNPLVEKSPAKESISKNQKSAVVIDKDGIRQESLPEVKLSKQKITE